MKKAEAKKWCIKKWEYIVNNNGSDSGIYDAIPELNKFESGCAYCELYIYITSPKFMYCADCPIRPKLKDYNKEYSGCNQKIHPYGKWHEAKTSNNKLKYAKELLELIKKS